MFLHWSFFSRLNNLKFFDNLRATPCLKRQCSTFRNLELAMKIVECCPLYLCFLVPCLYLIKLILLLLHQFPIHPFRINVSDLLAFMQDYISYLHSQWAIQQTSELLSESLPKVSIISNIYFNELQLFKNFKNKIKRKFFKSHEKSVDFSLSVCFKIGLLN